MKTLFFFLLLLSFAAHAEENLYQPEALTFWSKDSPDGKYLATTRPIPDSRWLWKPDMDTGRLEVVDFQGKQPGHYILYNFVRLAAQIQWSPDSKYLVFTTVSAGGHSPWHFNAFVYCVNDKSLRYMDQNIGLVVAPDFKFVGDHRVVMKVSRNGDTETPVPLTVDLAKEGPRMPKQMGKIEGDND